MAVKRFYAADMHTALGNIRTQLGEDAVILSTRQLEDGVEVSAAVDSASPRPTPDSSFLFGNGAPGRSTAYQTYADLESDVSPMSKELSSMRAMLQQWMDRQGFNNLASQSPVHAKLWQRFRLLGLSPGRIDSLLQEVPFDLDLSESWQCALKVLANQVQVVEQDLISGGGMFAVLGAAGSGKTSTIGKLATRAVIAHGSDAVALVSVDRYRIAAQEQLRTLGKILNVEVHTVSEGQDLGGLLAVLKDKHLVMIDTAGLTAGHEHFSDQLRQLREQQQVTPIVLVAATSQREVQERELSAFSGLNPRAAILTKLDEAQQIGGALEALSNRNIPIAFTTHGQSIPEDITTVAPQHLINTAVLISRDREQDESITEGFNFTASQRINAQDARREAVQS